MQFQWRFHTASVVQRPSSRRSAMKKNAKRGLGVPREIRRGVNLERARSLAGSLTRRFCSLAAPAVVMAVTSCDLLLAGKVDSCRRRSRQHWRATVGAGTDICTKSQAPLVEVEQRKGYEIGLEAAVAACR
jgi:hypothetical protein